MSQVVTRVPTKWKPAGLAHDDKYIAALLHGVKTPRLLEGVVAETPRAKAPPRPLALQRILAEDILAEGCNAPGRAAFERWADCPWIECPVGPAAWKRHDAWHRQRCEQLARVEGGRVYEHCCRWQSVASTVVKCTVVETERPSCRKQTDAAAEPGSPASGALLTADLLEAKGWDHEMLAAPDQDVEAASSLARVPMAGVKRRRKQSAGRVVIGALQRPGEPHKRHKLPDISELADKIATFLECMGGVGGWKEAAVFDVLERHDWDVEQAVCQMLVEPKELEEKVEAVKAVGEMEEKVEAVEEMEVQVEEEVKAEESENEVEVEVEEESEEELEVEEMEESEEEVEVVEAEGEEVASADPKSEPEAEHKPKPEPEPEPESEPEPKSEPRSEIKLGAQIEPSPQVLTDSEEEAPLSRRVPASPYRGNLHRCKAYRISKMRLAPVVVEVADDLDDNVFAEVCQTPRPDSRRPVARPHWRTPPPEKSPVALPPAQGDRTGRPHIWRPQASLAVARPHSSALAAPAAPAAPVAAGWTAASEKGQSAASQPAVSWPRGLTEIVREARPMQ